MSQQKSIVFYALEEIHGQPYSIPPYEEVRQILNMPPVRAVLLAEFAALSQQKADTPLASVTQELVQHLAHLDGKRTCIKSLLDGVFASEEEHLARTPRREETQ